MFGEEGNFFSLSDDELQQTTSGLVYFISLQLPVELSLSC